MKIKAEAKILVEESAGSDGMISPERVAAVCEYVDRKESPRRKTALLRAYAKLLEAELKKQEALVECSGEIGAATFEGIKEFIKKAAPEAPEKLKIAKRVNGKLLGGIRIRYGDNIWERTVRTALDALK